VELAALGVLTCGNDPDPAFSASCLSGVHYA
jgi:hypothetical protein